MSSNGGRSRIRTYDRPVMSRWLYQLSYTPLREWNSQYKIVWRIKSTEKLYIPVSTAFDTLSHKEEYLFESCKILYDTYYMPKPFCQSRVKATRQASHLIWGTTFDLYKSACFSCCDFFVQFKCCSGKVSVAIFGIPRRACWHMYRVFPAVSQRVPPCVLGWLNGLFSSGKAVIVYWPDLFCSRCICPWYKVLY